MLRRLISAVALLAVASAPVVGRARLFCRYTGIEITDCAEQEAPGSPVVQTDGCCDRQLTRPLGAVVVAQHEEVDAPSLIALPVPSSQDEAVLPPPARISRSAAVPTGPPVFLITRALLI